MARVFTILISHISLCSSKKSTNSNQNEYGKSRHGKD
ncbi:hypothetical protein E2C01_069097 [Portunus trituberculatus]|uniref:Uncharacterized protein n=1 Tax=Portunus trituberculatus TaxID=210409 RepID=A0A5B7HXN8_PORTR|nr:hypothetical protein [Portunus trituberculatus]